MACPHGVQAASLQPDGSLLVRWKSSIGASSTLYRLDRKAQRWVEEPHR